ncbi:hypothetical protein HS088_TW08G00356 [Tripterygium wilfordii]|uniref:MIF4G domain-containing protein n=1 Tax=Tripterygium wilfordii TaxID=458696 RepID=A0A7J7DBX7_TRIWF|nr:hypothetical protein HS088_TW08G00356 [Tripterygium wilfordii]
MSSWKSLLLRIGDQCPEYGTSSEVKDHIETCLSALRRELEHSRDDILTYVLQCAEQIPHKIPSYGTVVGLLNLESEDFVKKLVESTQTAFQGALDSGNSDKIRILMRFLTVMMCSKILQPGSLVIVFETLLSSAATTVDEEKGNPCWQPRADFYVACILSCLPWGGLELFEQVPEEIERVMVGVEAYLSIRRHVSDAGLSFFEDGDETGNDVVEKDFLEDLWSRIQVLSNNGWKVDSVPRPHLSFEAQLVAGKSHELGPISCPEQPHLPSQFSATIYGQQKHEAELKYPLRIHRLNIFPASKTEDLQPIDRFIIEEYLLDVLLFFNGCRKECASFMVSLPVPFRYEYLMAETIFSQFIWPWEEWAFVLDLPKWAPQRVFVQEVLEREVRLSYWDKIKQSIENAPALEELLPPRGGPNFSYSVEDGRERTEEHALSAELSSKVKGRQTARDIISWVEESVFPVHGFETTLKVVVQTLLDIGSKSFTHLITILERYGQVIARICPDHDKQVMLIVEVSSYWKNNTQMTAIAIDRMMGYRLISNLAIVRWVFSPLNIEQFHTSDRPWEVLRNAVSKTYNRISDLRREIVSLKKGVISAKKTLAKAKAELDAAEPKLTLVDGEPTLGENSASFSDVLIERLPDASKVGTLQALKAIHLDEMAVDLEESSAMEVVNENGMSKKSQSNGGKASNGYDVGEKEQWCLSTLGYVKAFSRQYASEIWPLIEKLDMEAFTEDAHPLFRNAVYTDDRQTVPGAIYIAHDMVESWIK